MGRVTVTHAKNYKRVHSPCGRYCPLFIVETRFKKNRKKRKKAKTNHLPILVGIELKTYLTCVF